MKIELDRTDQMILLGLLDDLAHEPPENAGGHPSLEVHERVGAAWADWDKKVSAWRLLLGVRLVNRALDTAEETGDERALEDAVRDYLDQFHYDDETGSRISWPEELAQLTDWKAPNDE